MKRAALTDGITAVDGRLVSSSVPHEREVVVLARVKYRKTLRIHYLGHRIGSAWMEATIHHALRSGGQGFRPTGKGRKFSVRMTETG